MALRLFGAARPRSSNLVLARARNVFFPFPPFTMARVPCRAAYMSSWAGCWPEVGSCKGTFLRSVLLLIYLALRFCASQVPGLEE